MKQIFTIWLFTICCFAYSQKTNNLSFKLDSIMPVRGLCLAAPQPKDIDEFVRFIDKELAPRHINTLILRVEFNFQYKSHPELRDSDALSKRDARKLVEVCRKNNIRIIPQIDLLGHQSWANKVGNLLKVYPEFDETPLIKMPNKYIWPNSDNLYCKSYCPLNPDVHKVIFALVDELCDGMDEVFYIGESQCPRCSGRDKAELFAGEVCAIRDHLAAKNRKLWIWGDRLLDGKTTGLGEWEASFNNTYKAIDLIPKDVIICDWHYDRPDPTPVYFAMKGFNVVTCPWKNPESTELQVQDMVKYRKHSTPEMSEHFMGMVQTIWSGTEEFLESYYGRKRENGENTQVNCFKAMDEEIMKIALMK